MGRQSYGGRQLDGISGPRGHHRMTPLDKCQYIILVSEIVYSISSTIGLDRNTQQSTFSPLAQFLFPRMY